MSWFPFPPLNAEGIVLYGFMAFGLAVGFALAVPIAERIQAQVGTPSSGSKSMSR
jgi:hypothetical protein